MPTPAERPGGPGLPVELERLLHDLRGPLNAMAMHVEILRRAGPGDPGAPASLATLHQELTRLSRLLPAAFEVLALERGELAAVDLRHLVERALGRAGMAGVSLADGQWPRVRADAGLVEIAVVHLVRNAVEATAAAGPGRPPPRLSAAAPLPGAVILTVRDWGSGLRSLNPRALIRLGGSDKPGRIGLGLPMAERVARLHGGRLDFRTPAGGGAEVALTLPAA